MKSEGSSRRNRAAGRGSAEPCYDGTMNPLMWVGVAAAVVVALALAGRFWRPSRGGQSDHSDLGSVTEGWLSEQRGRKHDS